MFAVIYKIVRIRESVDRNLLEISTEWPKRGKAFYPLWSLFAISPS